jgi:hypothetical protein
MNEWKARYILKVAVQGPDESWPTPYLHVYIYMLSTASAV